MNDENTIRARKKADGTLEQVLPDGSTRPFTDSTDWDYLASMTDEEAYRNALEDPDNPPLSAAELAKMRRVPNPAKLRKSMHLTQEEFARQFGIALGTLRDWEQSSRIPDSTAKSYLRVIEKNPDAVRQALGTDAPESAPSSGNAPQVASAWEKRGA